MRDDDQEDQDETPEQGNEWSGASDAALAHPFDLAALAEQVREMEAAVLTEFVDGVFRVADTLGAGRAKARAAGVTHYTQKMAEALGKSPSYVQKYLRLSEVPAEDRARALKQEKTFNGLWRHLFPSPTPAAGEKAKSEAPSVEESSAREDDVSDNGALDVEEPGNGKPDIDEPGDGMPDVDQPGNGTPDANDTHDPNPNPEPEVAVVASDEAGAADHSDTLLTALGVTTEMDALARITELMQAEYGGVVKKRLSVNDDRYVAIENQKRAIEAWKKELETRFTSPERALSIADVPLARK